MMTSPRQLSENRRHAARRSVRIASGPSPCPLSKQRDSLAAYVRVGRQGGLELCGVNPGLAQIMLFGPNEQRDLRLLARAKPTA